MLTCRPSGRWCPEESASFLSLLTFSWFTPLLLLGNSKPLQASDLFDLPARDKVAAVTPGLTRAWQEQLELKSTGKR